MGSVSIIYGIILKKLIKYLCLQCAEITEIIKKKAFMKYFRFEY